MDCSRSRESCWHGSTGLLIAAFMRVLPDHRLASVGMGVLITIQGVGQYMGSALVQVLLGPQLIRSFLLTLS